MLPFAQLEPSPNKPKSHGKHFKQKSVVQKLLVFFTNSRYQKINFGSNQFVPSAGIAIVFAELLSL